MKNFYRLGLDIGTNSLGWALWELGPDGPTQVIDMGVRVFSDGRETGKEIGESLAVQRRTARGMRRRRDRLLQRKKALVNFLVREKLWPKDSASRTEICKLNPYSLRAKAVSERLTGEELGRVLLHLCQRRGFKSNRKDASKDDESGKNKKRIVALDEALSVDDSETLGEFLNARKKTGARFRGETEHYPDRRHYIEEFDFIAQNQQKYFPDLDWAQLKDIIFFQRPLKPQQKGKCRIFEDQDRAYKCLPSSHRFRILQELTNLKIINQRGESVSLSKEEFHQIYDKLERQKTLSFNALRRILGIAARFNMESERREKLKGNETSCTLRSPEFFGALWDTMNHKDQDAVVDAIMDAEDDETIVDYLENLPVSLTPDQKEAVSKLNFSRAMGQYCAKHHRKCNQVMYRDFVDYSEAMEVLGYDHRVKEGSGKADWLPYYGEVIPESCMRHLSVKQNKEEAAYGKIGNPTVHVALNQLRKTINALIGKHGKPTEIVVEMGRELKQGRKKTNGIIKTQTMNQKNNEKLEAELKENQFNIVIPKRMDIEKLQYFKELCQKNVAAHCPYCGRTISGEELFSSSIEVEHILPFNRTMDDSRSNKTIAHRKCNRVKGNHTPFEAFGSNPEGYNWEDIQARVATLPNNKRRRFDKDAMVRYEKEEGGFLQRQLTDNAYIATVARKYLTAICPANKVWAVTGQHTAALRGRWKLNAILSKDKRGKNRFDHRHHAIDAAVIALTDRSLLKKIADYNKYKGDLAGFEYRVPDFPGGEEGYARLKSMVKDILPSVKPDHGIQGRFFKETAYGRVKKALLYDTAILDEEQVKDIVPFKIRAQFEDLVAHDGFEKARKKLREEHPQVRVLTTLWATRKPLIDLKRGDLNPPEKNGKNTKGPVDFGFRARLLEYLRTHSEKESEDKAYLERYGREHGIRHVRYIPKNQEITPIRSTQGEEKDDRKGKGYELGGFAYVEIWQLPKGHRTVYKGTFISYLEANRIAQGLATQRRPHPAAKKVMRLYKQDCLSFLEDGERKYYRVNSFSSLRNKIDIQPIWKSIDTRSRSIEKSDDDWFDSVNHDSVPGRYQKTQKQNFKSINVLMRKDGIRKISVYYTGEIR